MHYIIYSTSRSKKVNEQAAIWAEGLQRSKGREKITFEVRYKIPRTVKTAKNSSNKTVIDWEWFSETFPKDDADGVAFHFTPTYRRKWGIKSTINGSKNTDNKLFPEFWLCADLDEMAEGYEGKTLDLDSGSYPITEILRLLFHEQAHFDEDIDDTRGNGLIQQSVHHIDYEAKEIHNYPVLVDFRPTLLTWMQIMLRDLLSLRVEELEEKLEAQSIQLTHPAGSFKNAISQAYGVKSSIYTLTGHHIGTDYATPIGSPVYAPYDGTITVVGQSAVLGFFCHYHYQVADGKYTVRILHLSQMPKAGTYKQGDVIASTGNTGMSTGPHLHLDVWYNDVDMTMVNRTTWRDLTVDPETHFNKPIVTLK